jgi:hypothetical protein
MNSLTQIPSHHQVTRLGNVFIPSVSFVNCFGLWDFSFLTFDIVGTEIAAAFSFGVFYP